MGDDKPQEKMIKSNRFRVQMNLVQWHVIDSELEPADATGVGAEDDWSVAMWQRNQFGDEICRRKVEWLCNMLNELAAVKADGAMVADEDSMEAFQKWNGDGQDNFAGLRRACGWDAALNWLRDHMKNKTPPAE